MTDTSTRIEPDLEIVEELDIEHIVTEDEAPVDDMLSEKQQRLLTEPLYSSWAGPGEGRLFLASSNVGVFDQLNQPPVVPDMFLSLDVRAAQKLDELAKKKNRSYFVWEFGKFPDLVLEIVSNREGGEEGEKKRRYQRMRIPYYVVYDPYRCLSDEALKIYRFEVSAYQSEKEPRFPDLGLGLVLWTGLFEDSTGTWLRWTDAQGTILPTGRERADLERERADQERERADQERERADLERERADLERERAARLAERLRQAGIDPEAP